jgi:transcriptional regulator with XRE-family HTH domain
MRVGDRLRSIRKAQGLTQRALAAAAGMPAQYVSDLERGRIRNPSLETLSRVANALGIGVGELIGRGLEQRGADLPEGLRALLADPEWGEAITPEWVDTLLGVEHAGRRLQSKAEFLEAYLALRRLFEP